MKEDNKKLPAGWEVKKLGEVCEIATGKWDANHAVANGKYRFYTCAKEFMKCETKRFCNECLILPGNGVNVGEVYYYKGEFDVYQRTYVLSKICSYPKYLYYHMQTYWKQRNLTKQYGSATNFVKMANFTDYTISLPPLPEQKRIVAILDKAFEAIAKAKENAEKNRANARELFDGYLNQIFANPGKDWEEKKVGDKDILQLVDGDRGSNYPKKSEFFDSGYCVFMNTKNVRPNGFDFSSIIFISEKKDKILGKGKISRNDVVMTTRGTIGNIGLYSEDIPYENIRINSGMLIFRPNIKKIHPEYLFEILRSGIMKSQIEKNTTGAAQPQLPIKTLVDFVLPVPNDIAEQKVIVSKVKKLYSETKSLESIYTQKIADLDELKKSILQKAFAGEL